MVGFGPGDPLDRTRRAEVALARSEVIVGYAPYLERIDDLIVGQERRASGMRQEVERVREALRLAAAGRAVALVSSGDPGVYGMAGLALEVAEKDGLEVPIEIVPGLTAGQVAAARTGAPLMLDYATISLSDLLVPLDQILYRLEAALRADFVVCLYNPKSRQRLEPFAEAMRLIRTYRRSETPLAVARALGQAEESVRVTSVARLDEAEVDMKSVVIVGNTSTRRCGPWMVTPRGYRP